MLSSRTLGLAALMGLSTLTLGCPRTFTVHIDTREMTRIKPVLARSPPWDLSKHTQPRLTTSAGMDLPLDKARVLSWTGDDGKRWSSPYFYGLVGMAGSPEHGQPFYPPRGGTWTILVPDETALSSVGKYTTITGGIGTAAMVAAILMTAMFAGPEPSFDVGKTLHTEGLILIGPVGVATAGGILWAAGNLAYQCRDPDLGHGTFVQ